MYQPLTDTDADRSLHPCGDHDAQMHGTVLQLPAHAHTHTQFSKNTEDDGSPTRHRLGDSTQPSQARGKQSP